MTAHKNFKYFIKRFQRFLRRLRLKSISKSPTKLISDSHLNKKIVDIFDVLKIQIKIIHSLIKKSEKILILEKKLISFFYRNLIIHFSKEKNGRYRLYLEVKNKSEDQSKQVLLNFNGDKNIKKQNINMTAKMIFCALKQKDEINKNENKNKNENDSDDDSNDDKNKQLIFSIIKHPACLIQKKENDVRKTDSNVVIPAKVLAAPRIIKNESNLKSIR